MIQRLYKAALAGMTPIVVPLFHLIWYNHPDSWVKNTFLGFPIWQNPLDLQLYQELLFTLKPQFVLQTGIAQGGSLLYYASMLDLMGAPPDVLVIGIDIEHTDSAKKLNHPRIRKIIGSSTDPDVVKQVEALIGTKKGLVVLDSDHSEQHVTKELAIYAKYVPLGGYLVVEDTNVNGHPVQRHHGPGPMEAMLGFLAAYPAFVLDDMLPARNLYSHHGWLRRMM